MAIKNKKEIKNLESNLFKWGEYPAIFTSPEEREEIKSKDYNSINYLLKSTNLEDFFMKEIRKLGIDRKPFEKLEYSLETKSGACLFLMNKKGLELNDKETEFLNKFLNSSKKTKSESEAKPKVIKNYYEDNPLLELLDDIEDSFMFNIDHFYNLKELNYNRSQQAIVLKKLEGLIEEFQYALDGGEGYENNRGTDYSERLEILVKFKSELLEKEANQIPKVRKPLTKEKKVSLLEMSTQVCEAIQKKSLNPAYVFESSKMVIYNQDYKRLYFIYSDTVFDLEDRRKIKNSSEKSYWISLKKTDCLVGIRNSEKSFQSCIGAKTVKKPFNGIIPKNSILLWRA